MRADLLTGRADARKFLALDQLPNMPSHRHRSDLRLQASGEAEPRSPKVNIRRDFGPRDGE